MENKFHYNAEMHQWERIERVQEYKGIKIETITYHRDYLLNRPENHREYRITWRDGHTSEFGINKRGGNIKSIKEYIDFKIKYNEI